MTQANPPPPILSYAHPAPRRRATNKRAANAFFFAMAFPIFAAPMVTLASILAHVIHAGIGGRPGWVLGVLTAGVLVGGPLLLYLRDAVRSLGEIAERGESNRRQAVVAVVVLAVYLTLDVVVAGVFAIG